MLLLTLLATSCAAPSSTATPPPTPTDGPSPTVTAPSATPAPAASLLPSPSATVVPASPTPSAPATPSSTPPPGAVEGTLTIWSDSVRTPVLLNIAAEFTSDTGVPVKVETLNFDDIAGLVANHAQAGNGPDVFIAAHDRLGELVPAGVVEPVDLGPLTDSFRPIALSAFTYAGQVYGVPYLSQAAALFYNTDLVPNGNPPATWSELKTMSAEFQADDPTKQGYCLQQGDAYHSHPLLTGFGGYVFGKGADESYDPADVGLDTPGGLASATELDSMVKDGLLRADVDYGTCATLMTTGKALFWITGPWAMPDFVSAGLAFGVAPIPPMANESRPFVSAQGVLVSHFAKNSEAALTFLTDYIATYDAMEQFWQVDPRLPTWNELAASITDPAIVAFTNSADAGDPLPAIPEMASTWVPWMNALNLIFRQEQEPESAFRDAAATIRGLIGP